MASTRDFNIKIKSFKNTQKITKTMKMVSASKLRRANQAQAAAKEYSQKLQALILRVLMQMEHLNSPIFQKKEDNDPQNILILVVTSDRGLCGGYNNNLIKFVDQWIKENIKESQNVDLSFCGKRGYQRLKKTYSVHQYYEGVTQKPLVDDAKNINEDLLQSYENKQYDRIYLAYNLFHTAIKQDPFIEQFLPLNPSMLDNDIKTKNVDTIFEPSKEDLLESLLPQFLQFKIFYTLLENAAGEHGARMTAMDNATNNTTDLINKYTLMRNRARQAAITTELIEIISGAEALNN